ncbi:MAG: type II secretion system protein [Verrucomicrobiota bacterium]
MRVMKRDKRSGFTLVELLVVMTIVAILMGLAIPGVGIAFEAAKKAQAGVVVNQLKVAMTNYKTEYGRWPVYALQNPEPDEILEAGMLYYMLTGTEEKSKQMDNPRRIPFMEFNLKDLRQGPPDANNVRPPVNPEDADTFVDPWNREYLMVFDLDYDNRVLVPSLNPNLEEDVYMNTSMAFWSTGADGDVRAKYIATWK